MLFGAKHGPWRLRVWFTASLILLLVFGVDSFGQTHIAPDAAGKALHAIEQGRLSEAEALLEEAVRAEPGNANYAFALANVYLVSGKPKLAIPVLQKCLRLTPGDWEARIALAQAYQKVDADSEALRTLGTVPPPGRRALAIFARLQSLSSWGCWRCRTPIQAALGKQGNASPCQFFPRQLLLRND